MLPTARVKKTHGLSCPRIVSSSSTPSWHSTSGANVNDTIADVITLQHVFEKAATEKLPKMPVLVGLFSGTCILVRRTAAEGEAAGPWMFGLGGLSSTLCHGWPAVEGVYTGTEQKFYELDLGIGFEQPGRRLFFPLFILDEGEWEAMEYQWASPMHQWVRWRGAEQVQGYNNHVRAVPTTPAMPIIQLAARCAFWGLSSSYLVQLARHLECEVAAGSSIFTICWTLVQFVLGLPDDEVLDILHRRCVADARRSNMNLLEWASLEGIKDNFTKDEQKEYEKTVDSEKCEKEERKTFKESFRAKKREVREAKARAAAAPDAPCKRRGRPPAAEKDPWKSMKFLGEVPAAITQDRASKMSPPGGYVWACWRDSMWRGHLKPYPRISATWAAYGHHEACLHVLRILWTRYLNDMDLPVSSCPVKGLF